MGRLLVLMLGAGCVVTRGNLVLEEVVRVEVQSSLVWIEQCWDCSDYLDGRICQLACYRPDAYPDAWTWHS